MIPEPGDGLIAALSPPALRRRPARPDGAPAGLPGRRAGRSARGDVRGRRPAQAGGTGQAAMAYAATPRSSSVLAPSLACCDMPCTTAAK